MAASSVASAATSCSISRPVCLEPSKLLACRLLHCREPGGFRTSSQRLSSQPRRRILPVYIEEVLTNFYSYQIQQVKAVKQTFSSIDDLLGNSDKPVLVDFYATWCGPCQFMVPILDEVSTRMKDKIVVVKIDTEKYPEIASQYEVEALPTFIIFRDGKPCYRFEGALPADQLIELVEDVLKVAQ